MVWVGMADTSTQHDQFETALRAWSEADPADTLTWENTGGHIGWRRPWKAAALGDVGYFDAVDDRVPDQDGVLPRDARAEFAAWVNALPESAPSEATDEEAERTMDGLRPVFEPKAAPVTCVPASAVRVTFTGDAPDTQAAIDASKARQADLVVENDRLRDALRRSRNDLRACAERPSDSPLDARAEFEPKGGALAVDPYELATALGWHGPAFGMVEAVAMLRGALTEDRTALATVVTQRDEALAENEDLRSALAQVGVEHARALASQSSEPAITGRPAEVAGLIERVLAAGAAASFEGETDPAELARAALLVAFPEGETATEAMVAIHREQLEHANAEIERLTAIVASVLARAEAAAIRAKGSEG